MKYKHIVVGSGLASIGAIRALIENGYKPLVIDLGRTMPNNSSNLIPSILKNDSTKWSKEERKKIFRESLSLSNILSMPKKTSLKSKFFYGSVADVQDITFHNQVPPFSFALGGLAEGWGASFLPPSKTDIANWPLDYDEVINNFEHVLSYNKISASIDDLSNDFPILKSKTSSINISKEDESFLNKLKVQTSENKDFICGKSRLFLDVDKCQYCGECMSGCLFDAIYKPSQEIKDLILRNKIIYKNGLNVIQVKKLKNVCEIVCLDKNNIEIIFKSHKIYIGAGAFNTSKIILNSFYKNLNKSLKIRTRGGFIVPGLFLNKRKLIWPAVNTLPSLFFEYKDKINKKWIHIQYSSNNELLINRIKFIFKKLHLYKRLKNFIPRFTALFVSLNSDEAGYYHLSFNKKSNRFNSSYIKNRTSNWKRDLFLYRIFFSAGLLLFFPFKKNNTGTFHTGASFPMSKNYDNWSNTNIYGELFDKKNIHLIDSSVLPSLPATTIGILSMSNAYRIAKETSHDK